MSAAVARDARRPTITEGRRELHDVLRTVRTMEERRLNPFLMDVARTLALVDRFFPSWRALDDLTLDARALNALSRVLRMQEARLRYQAQLFHADPEAVAEKLTALGTDRLGRLFLECWHPAVGLEQLTPEFLAEAKAYWDALLPVEERRRERPRKAPPEPETVTLDDLLARGVLARDGFGTTIAELWGELQRRGPVDYWEFIGAPSYGERVKRAYATSYLVTYGYGWLSQENGSLQLHPRREREPPKQSVSLPILITR